MENVPSFMGKKRGAPQAATLAVCSPQVLRTHMQSAVRRALEAADSFYHGVVGGMSAFLFEQYFFLKQYLQSGFLQVSGVYGNVQKVSKNISFYCISLYIYMLYYHQDITLLLHMCISI